jgi:hypothetical protein
MQYNPSFPLESQLQGAKTELEAEISRLNCASIEARSAYTMAVAADAPNTHKLRNAYQGASALLQTATQRLSMLRDSTHIVQPQLQRLFRACKLPDPEHRGDLLWRIDVLRVGGSIAGAAPNGTSPHWGTWGWALTLEDAHELVWAASTVATLAGARHPDPALAAYWADRNRPVPRKRYRGG